ncbi:MAG: hypothetical protein CMH25_04945 [Micavibrio sp.]|nr:hypothetical protein [Micavibrio sp.]|tara:strand:+ start:38 stop:877 length:840 start_codon:yes stop_codon:yes gene_type:complete
MAFYWVNIGKTYKEVEKHGFLWAPAYNINKKGNKTLPAGWKHVPEVKKGDIIFCNLGNNIQYIAEANKDAYPCTRPTNREYDEWKDEGYKIEVSITNLATPTPATKLSEEFIELYNSHTSPKLFNSNGKITENYLYHLDNTAGVFLLSHVNGFNPNIRDSDIDLENERGKRLSYVEKKQYRLHKIYEGRINTQKVKDKLGHSCTACNLKFTDIYGELGENFIEAHHLVPYSQLKEGQEREINIEQDFVVLCANCHRMIHRMDDVSDLEGLRRIIKCSNQ